MMAKQYTVQRPFSLNLTTDEIAKASLKDRVDPDGMVRFGPGEVVPDALSQHWYVMQMVGVGSASEEVVKDEAPKVEPTATSKKSTG